MYGHMALAGVMGGIFALIICIGLVALFLYIAYLIIKKAVYNAMVDFSRAGGAALPGFPLGQGINNAGQPQAVGPQQFTQTAPPIMPQTAEIPNIESEQPLNQ